MQSKDHAVWDRIFPVKYLLVREDEEGEDGEEQLWARCAAVEGLFVDPVPPPREVLTLRGYAPAGSSRDAMIRPEAAAGLLGDMLIEVSDGTQPVGWWELVDAVVLAQHPCRTDPSLVDVVMGAGVKKLEGGVRTPPASPRFELFTGMNATAGHCLAVDGLFTPRQEPAKIPMELIGCEPTEPLLSVLRRPSRWERAGAELWTLDRTGRTMARHFVGLGIDGARPSVLGGALIDITLTDGGDNRPSPATRTVWESWYRGFPTAPNQWAPYASQGRAEWLRLTLQATRARCPDRSGGVHHLDGRYITDVPGLHCALGEALTGPGGYFGWGWDAFRDCLCGGFGVAPPFTLIWHDAGTARRALADVVYDPEEGLSYFEEVVQTLERSRVTVVLDE
ncbi:barstar family protein [Streptomyces libani]